MRAKEVLLLIASIFCIFGTGYSTFFFMKPKNLKDELMVNKYTFLKKNDTASWKKLADTYKYKKEKKHTIKVGSVDIKWIEGLDGIDEGNAEGIEKLQKKCDEILEEELDYKKIDLHREEVKNWCVKESVLLKSDNLAYI